MAASRLRARRADLAHTAGPCGNTEDIRSHAIITQLFAVHQCVCLTMHSEYSAVFSRYLTAFEMSAADQQAVSVFEFLTCRLWVGDKQNQAKAMSPNTDLNGSVTLLLLITALGLSSHCVAAHAAAALLLVLREPPADACIAGWTRAAGVASLSLLHAHQSIVGDLAAIAASTILHSSDLVAQERAEILTVVPGIFMCKDGWSTNSFSDPPEHVLTLSLAFAVAVDVSQSFSLNPLSAMRFRQILVTLSRSRRTALLGWCLAFCDLCLLENSTAEDLVRSLSAEVQSAKEFRTPSVVVWTCMILPRLVQLSSASVEKEDMGVLLSTTKTDYWGWLRLARSFLVRGMASIGAPNAAECLRDSLQELIIESSLQASPEGDADGFVMAACGAVLLGLPMAEPTILTGPGDSRNKYKQSTQAFFQTVSSVRSSLQ